MIKLDFLKALRYPIQIILTSPTFLLLLTSLLTIHLLIIDNQQLHKLIVSVFFEPNNKTIYYLLYTYTYIAFKTAIFQPKLTFMVND